MTITACSICKQPMMETVDGWRACAVCDGLVGVLPDDEPDEETSVNPYIKSALIRAGRTFVQTFLGVYVAGLLAMSTATLSDFANLSLLDQAAAAGIVSVLALVQNLLEGRASAGYDRG